MWLATVHLRFQKPSSSLIPCIEQVAQSDVGGYCAHQIAHWELLSRVQQVNDDLPSSDLMYAVSLQGSWEASASTTADSWGKYAFRRECRSFASRTPRAKWLAQACGADDVG